MKIDPRTGGWQSVKQRIAELANRVNALSDMRVVRSGKGDAFTWAANGATLSLRQMPRGGGAAPSQASAGVTIIDSESPFSVLRHVPASLFTSGYAPSTDDDWLLEFGTSGWTYTGGTSSTALDDAAGGSQTFYRLPVIRTVPASANEDPNEGDPIKVTYDPSGVYIPETLCMDGYVLSALRRLS